MGDPIETKKPKRTKVFRVTPQGLNTEFTFEFSRANWHTMQQEERKAAGMGVSNLLTGFCTSHTREQMVEILDTDFSLEDEFFEQLTIQMQAGRAELAKKL